MQRRGDEPRVLTSEPALRVIMRRLREIMSEPGDGQSRLDKIVKQIAGVMVTEVCSIYLKRQDGSLELFASEGLKSGAVHTTRMKRGEGLVGRCAELNITVNEPEASATRRSPIGRRRARRSIAHCSRCRPALPARCWACSSSKPPAEECRRGASRVLQATAIVVAEHLRLQRVRGRRHRDRIGKSLSAVIEGRADLGRHRAGPHRAAQPRIVVTQLLAEDGGVDYGRLDRHCHAARFAGRRHRDREHLAGAGGRRRCSTSRMFAHDRLGAAAARPSRAGSRRCRPDDISRRHARAHAAPERCLLARARRDLATCPTALRVLAGRITARTADRFTFIPKRPLARTIEPASFYDYDRRAAARPRRRRWQRTEPRGRRRQALGIAAVGPARGTRRARQCRRRGDHRRPRGRGSVCVPPRRGCRLLRQARFSPQTAPVPCAAKDVPTVTKTSARRATHERGLLVDIVHLRDGS